MDQTLARIANHQQKALTDDEFNAKFGSDPEAMKRVLKFATDNGLTAAEVDPNSGRVLLRGKVKNFNEAFKITLEDFQGPLGISREHTGAISVPKNIGKDIKGVLGLENHAEAQQLQSYARRNEDGGFSPHVPAPGYTPFDAAKAYQFPEGNKGAGQGVAIIELSGGLDLNDNAAYYKEHGLKLPDINIVNVDAGKNVMGEQRANDEVALDTQMIGALAPDAKQMLIFTSRSDQGFVDAITRATFTKPGETANSVINICWGAPESAWTPEARDAMHLALKKAAIKGITVMVASGDDGAKNGTNRFTADYPAADQYVTATGGTELRLNADGSIASEVGWNGSGGGISELSPVPDFQREVQMPSNANHDSLLGRGVPDVSGNAAKETPFKFRVGGTENSIHGTSAVAPLYAALVLQMNGALGQRVGYLNPFLYKQGNTEFFRDVTAGNNGGYSATEGWDAVTGWGSIRGKALQDALAADFRRTGLMPSTLA
jgi:kumamolisin